MMHTFKKTRPIIFTNLQKLTKHWFIISRKIIVSQVPVTTFVTSSIPLEIAENNISVKELPSEKPLRNSDNYILVVVQLGWFLHFQQNAEVG